MRALLLAGLVGLAAVAAAAQPQQQQRPSRDPRSPDFVAPPDSNYDPRSDANHPLKNPDADPGAAWVGHRRTDGTPSLPGGEGDWPWGELVYGGAYQSLLTVRNHCTTPQTVRIFVNDLPFLQLPRTVQIPADSSVDVAALFTAPPEPDPPLRTGVPGEPGWGWVDPPLPSPVPGAPRFHQPNFADVKGTVVVWHPWAGICFPRRDSYAVTAHIHFGPPADDDSGPEKIAEPDRCMTWWLTGERPEGLDEDCTDKMRGYAVDWRERIAGPFAAADPEAWGWLPSAGAVGAMTIEQLLAMKARGDALMGAAAAAEAQAHEAEAPKPGATPREQTR